MPNQFEKDFEAKFLAMRKKTGAYLYRLYPPMRIGGMRGTMPCWIQVGRALFDVAGWIPFKPIAERMNMDHDDWNNMPSLSIPVGIELKENGESHTSMRIIGDDGEGSGLQAHQLEALAAVHRDGGIARVLWNNGGTIAVLDGPEIAQAHFTYGVSVQAEKMRKKPALGSRSIPWKLFRKVDFDNEPEEIILPPKVDPTLAEELKKKRRKNAKLIQAAEDAKIDASIYETDID